MINKLWHTWRNELARIARFFCVALLACIVDAGLGLFVINRLQAGMLAGVVAGFSAGLVCAYVLHSLWTFRLAAQSGGLRQALDLTSSVRFVCSNLLLLVLRLGIVSLLEAICTKLDLALSFVVTTSIYVIMLGISFCINYVMCKMWVFKQGA